MSFELIKYPRTPHLQGSKLQPGDEDLEQVPLRSLRGRHIVVEEKVDGANCAISFTREGELRLQSRGHYLQGGPREKQFGPLKTWAASLTNKLWQILGQRYVMYGEWLYAKHTVFYDRLPHYFLEFDIFDRQDQVFLSTSGRQKMLHGQPISSVPVLAVGDGELLARPGALVGRSRYKSAHWRDSLLAATAARALCPDRIWQETDPSCLAEGLYIKVEEDGVVRERSKWVRPDFLQVILGSGSHWHDRPLLPNLLVPGQSLFD
jgi:hypothetical protein